MNNYYYILRNKKQQAFKLGIMYYKKEYANQRRDNWTFNFGARNCY